jgi:hypothetical protein
MPADQIRNRTVGCNVRNNPINFVDPAGLCRPNGPEDLGQIDDCTQEINCYMYGQGVGCGDFTFICSADIHAMVGCGARRAPPPVMASQLTPPAPTIGPNTNYEGSKKQLCDQKSDKAFWADILPFGSTLLGGDSTPSTVVPAAVGMAAGKAVDHVAGSPTALRYIRALTGMPMTLTSKILTAAGWVTTAYSGYHALEAAKEAYQACVAN